MIEKTCSLNVQRKGFSTNKQKPTTVLIYTWISQISIRVKHISTKSHSARARVAHGILQKMKQNQHHHQERQVSISKNSFSAHLVSASLRCAQGTRTRAGRLFDTAATNFFAIVNNSGGHDYFNLHQALIRIGVTVGRVTLIAEPGLSKQSQQRKQRQQRQAECQNVLRMRVARKPCFSRLKYSNNNITRQSVRVMMVISCDCRFFSCS